MLQAQVNYWNLVENAKHNRATEQLGLDTLIESIRHSKVTEANESAKNKELQRHNMASETLESISNRAKMLSSEAAQMQAQTAAIRAGYDYEVGMGANAIAARNADTNAYNAQTSHENLDVQREGLDVRRQEMYAGMANAGIGALGRMGSTVLGNVTRKQPINKKVIRIVD